ncbi:MAG TPA: hypothetical protein VKZ56_00080 [Membranihabitans sp.]|nr:hypothetical protein [Membranihabitans sp.]
MKKFEYFLCCFLVFTWACDDNGSDDPEPRPMHTVKLANHPGLGTLLTDADGMTLYFFSRDAGTNSACIGGCLNNWPVFYADELLLDEGLEESDFAMITRSDGTTQTTYKGWPLYYFANDQDPGDVAGEGANGIWYVAKPDYTVMIVNAQLTGADGNQYNVNDAGEYEIGEGNTVYLTDAEGNTLYGFINDRFETNNFTNEDFSNNGAWPIFEADPESIPSTLETSDFSVIDVHGRSQLTFRGWPIYYFGNDSNRGDNKGVSVPSPGVWPILNPDTETAPE